MMAFLYIQISTFLRHMPRKSNRLPLEFKNSCSGFMIELLLRLFPASTPTPSPPASLRQAAEVQMIFIQVLLSPTSFEMLHSWFPRESLLAKGDCASTCPRKTLCLRPFQVFSWVPLFLGVLPSGLQGDSSVISCFNLGDGTVRAQVIDTHFSRAGATMW